jgi:hypothetical protein
MENIELLANEYSAYMEFLGFGEEELTSNSKGGYDIEPSSKFMYEANRDERAMNTEIIEALKDRNTNIPALREKLQKFKKETIYMSGKRLLDFQMFLDEYFEDFKAEQQADERDLMDAEDTRLHQREVEEAERLLTIEEERQKAMERPTIQEPIKDYSERYGTNISGSQPADYTGYTHTGVGVHRLVGDDSKNRLINEKTAQEIRTLWWAGKTGHSPRVTIKTLEGLYPSLSRGGITNLIYRSSWFHLPLVEHEPVSQLSKLSSKDQKVKTYAKKLGIQPIRNEEGRLRLPDETIIEIRKQAKEKKDKK